jgi:hypothetical protein
MTDDEKRQRDLEEVRRKKARIDALLAEQEAAASSPAASSSSADLGAVADPPVVQRRGEGPSRFKAILALVAFIVLPILLAMVASTLSAYSGTDFSAARRTGQAQVLSCDRRGPVGLLQLGYWDDCTVKTRWNDGNTFTGKLGKRNLFTAADIGKTVEIGDNGRKRSGHVYSRPDKPEKPALRILATVVIVLDILPLLALIWAVVYAIRHVLRRK